ncbi:hypothetical protein N0V83_008029 [Neocucurbitaria cava]|uniref:Uncharacterized protein n=1 Tax=Neocucurbitaria cava TaxID=798079 RepID=A0A9W8Y2T3_9PLEO|nr:hypothetical protein N0V83_008029 [Neocucurbitaria cava]
MSTQTTNNNVDVIIEIMEAFNSMIKEARDAREINAPIVAAGQELTHPWILNVKRWDFLKQAYYTLHGFHEWVGRYENFITFAIAFNAMANGQPLNVPVMIHFYNRNRDDDEPHYLYNAQHSEIVNPGSTGTQASDLECHPVQTSDSFVKVEFNLMN